ncbi:MAG: hypothetical protein VX246_03995 [Myxococcota bacterium]|nr:hypothetical protein [Myxococcota bacterium]
MHTRVLGLVTIALLTANTAGAAMIYSDDLDDFSATWTIRWKSDATATQESGSVTLSTAADASSSPVLGLPYVAADKLTHIVIDHELTSGGFSMAALCFATIDGEYTKLGSVDLGYNPGGVIDLSGVDLSAAEDIRLRFVLDPGTELSLDSIEIHASAAPEPSAATLMVIGLMLTGIHLRGRFAR